MNCREMEHALDQILEGEGSRQDRNREEHRIQAHLAVCAACRSRSVPLLEWIERLRQGPDVPLPRRISEPPRIQDKASKPRTRTLWLTIFRIAAAVAILGGGALWLRGTDPRDTETRSAAVIPRPPVPDRIRPGRLQKLIPLVLERRETTLVPAGKARLTATFRSFTCAPDFTRKPRKESSHE